MSSAVPGLGIAVGQGNTGGVGPGASGRGGRCRVLVAEDDPLMQIVTAATLSALGYETDVVSNGREAVTAVSGHDYVAVLMDCQMPEMDGYQATAEIRRLEVGYHRRTPIIALTATPREDGPQACLVPWPQTFARLK